jgi:hypothetical protein
MPCRNISLNARADRRYIRSTYRSNRFVLAQLRAPHAHPEEGRSRPPVNLAFVLDRSGSMSGEAAARESRRGAVHRASWVGGPLLRRRL